MHRVLTSGVLALLLLSSFAAVPTQAAGGPGTPWSSSATTSNIPTGCTSLFSDGCYHMRGGLNALDSPKIDVVLVVPASPFAERDLRAMHQVVSMYDAGIDYIADNEGWSWLADGVEFHVTPMIFDPVNGNGGEFSTYPVWDPEIVIFRGNPFFVPVGLGAIVGIGIDPLAQWPCYPGGVKNPFDLEEWEAVPGFDSHHDGRSGTYTEDCGGSGGNVCFAVNGGAEVLPDFDLFGINVYDLVAHEFGHCLRLGHVGDPGTEFLAAKAPLTDIMSYAYQDTRKCVSSLDVETFAVAMSPYLDVNGDGAVTPADRFFYNDKNGNNGFDGSPFQVQKLSDHYYASSTGLAKDCPQPDLGMEPFGEPVDFMPAGGNTASAELSILSPVAGATVGGPLTVSGTVQVAEAAAGSAGDGGAQASRRSLPGAGAAPAASALPAAVPALGADAAAPQAVGKATAAVDGDGDAPSGVRGLLGRLWDRLVGNDRAAAKHTDPSGEVPVTSMDVRRIELADATASHLVFELEVEGMGDLPPSVDLQVPEVAGGGLTFKHGVVFCSAAPGVPASYATATYGAGASECYTVELTQDINGDVLSFSTVDGDGSGCGQSVPAGLTASVEGDVVTFNVPRDALRLANHAADLNACLNGATTFTGDAMADGERLTYLVGQTRASAGFAVTANPTLDSAGGILDPQHTVTTPATDADMDGVLNADDACPGTPAGRAVDSTGCPLATATGTVALFVGATRVGLASVDTSASGPWSIPGVDLSAFSGTVLLEAVLSTSGGDELDRDSVSLTVEAACGGSAEGPEDGGGASGCLGNEAPEILEDTFALSADLLEEDGTDHALVVSVALRDVNRADHLDIGSLKVSFSPADRIVVDEESLTTEATDDDTVLVVHVPVTVQTGAAPGLYGVTVSVKDLGVEGHPETVLQDTASFADVLEVLPAGDLTVTLVGRDYLDFGSFGSGDEDVESLNHFVVRNALHEAHAIVLAMDDLANLDEGADCSDPAERDCIRVEGNLVAIVDTTAEPDGTFTFADATEVRYTQDFEEIGELADGASMGVKLRILEIGSIHPGSYGTTFSVAEL